jgi:hypothetical protein
MTHHIIAAIGSPPVIERVAAAAGCPPPTQLPGGLTIAALGESQIDRLTALEPGGYSDGFIHLSEALERALSSLSRDGALAYVETDYFGGTGSQAAAVFHQGKVALKLALPDSRELARREDPINAALRMLGVEAAEGLDEFDTVGLGRFRGLDDLGVAEADED